MPPWPDRFARTPADRDALLRLASMANFPPRKLFELAERRRTARGVLEAVLDGEGTPSERSRVRAASADDLRERLAACGARQIVPGDEEYPPTLEDLFDPPAWLFVRGLVLSELAPRVAMVGARQATTTGRDLAREIGGGLARAGVVVVSGGARGIDGESHEGALAAKGQTIAVLGCGIDRAYPASNRGLLERIEAHGALVSEYPPGVPAEPFRFPARNRIVAALGDALVVVEGAAGSGSLISVRHALDLGRDVYAVPGSVASALSEVPLQLIRDGATMIRGSGDLLFDLGLVDADGRPTGTPADLTDEERAVLRVLGEPMLPERIAAAVGCDLTGALTVLLGLEMRGLVRSIGGRFEPRLVRAG